MLKFTASITIEKRLYVRLYKCKKNDKLSHYNIKSKKAVVRISGSKFAKGISSIEPCKKEVKTTFNKEGDIWYLTLKRVKKGNKLQTYLGYHPHLQLVLNKSLPKELWEEYDASNKKTYTKHVYIKLNLNEWKDIDLRPCDFLLEVEKQAKALMNCSFDYGFKVEFVPKGRSYDLELIGPKGTVFILAISSHVAKNESRNKEKRKQKILMDISKILPELYSREVLPVIISEPLEFKGSWSFTTEDYLNFYKDKFNFKFLTTMFKKDWENDMCKQLLELDKNGK